MEENLGGALSGVLGSERLPEGEVGSVGFYLAEFAKCEQVASDTCNGFKDFE